MQRQKAQTDNMKKQKHTKSTWKSNTIFWGGVLIYAFCWMLCFFLFVALFSMFCLPFVVSFLFSAYFCLAFFGCYFCVFLFLVCFFICCFFLAFWICNFLLCISLFFAFLLCGKAIRVMLSGFLKFKQFLTTHLVDLHSLELTRMWKMAPWKTISFTTHGFPLPC